MEQKGKFEPYGVTQSAYKRLTEPADSNTEDHFYWLSQINKASLVINSSEGLLDTKYVKEFAQGLKKVIKNGNQGGPRPQKVIDFEPYWIKESGPEVSRIHAGRSSQDMLTTASMAVLRRALLDLDKEIHAVEEELMNMADRYKTAVMPAYTNGVAAQPTSYAHYLLAFVDAFRRDNERLRQFYDRVNQCAMGSTVLNGTGWPLNRQRMSDYLGFARPFENCFDATQIFTDECSAETAGLCTVIAIHTGNFVADVMLQYSQPRPWILLQEGGANTYVSSAMPQKRNPGILNNLRTKASTILGEATGAVYRTHNIATGFADPRGLDLTMIVWETEDLMKMMLRVLQALVFNEERALEELNLDWTASQEIADRLMREYNVPFRIGHHVASDIVGYARAHDIRPLDFPHEIAERIYLDNVAALNLSEVPEHFPLDEAEFRATLDPKAIIARRAVSGGPQPEEVQRMYEENRKSLEADELWRLNQEDALATAKKELEAKFTALLK
ncbi:MAG: argininosuccinate lyase [Veillonella sp.]|uniref:lyase family protein n=1 Tax=Veillonella sp. TaxID=1926307 RepID=UPI0025CC217A|nr:lyase family protein [Veillonella sp.]MBS4912596.1 argininosuccinate lyase [Veillonella sp.]